MVLNGSNFADNIFNFIFVIKKKILYFDSEFTDIYS